MPTNVNPTAGWYDLYHSAPASRIPDSPSAYNYNPVYGGNPLPLPVPDPSADLSSVLPGLGSLNPKASSDILAELSGQVSPDTQAMIQNKAASFGTGSGMPGSGLAHNLNLRDLGLTSEGQIAQGVSDYSKLIPTVSGTQTVSPALQTEIANRNTNNAAAPVPAQAQSYAQQLFSKYLQNMRGPGGGTGSNPLGTGDPFGVPNTGAGALGFGFGSQGATPTATGNVPGAASNWLDPSTMDDTYFSNLYSNSGGGGGTGGVDDWSMFDVGLGG